MPSTLSEAGSREPTRFRNGASLSALD